MRLATASPEIKSALAAGLSRYLSGNGRHRLQEQGIDPRRLNARGVIAEAQLDHESVLALDEDALALGSYFPRRRILLFNGDEPIGSVGLLPAKGSYRVEHVTLGGIEMIVAGLSAGEEVLASKFMEARLLRIPEIFLTSLFFYRPPGVAPKISKLKALIAKEAVPRPFRVLTLPSSEAAMTLAGFKEHVAQLAEQYKV